MGKQIMSRALTARQAFSNLATAFARDENDEVRELVDGMLDCFLTHDPAGVKRHVERIKGLMSIDNVGLTETLHQIVKVGW